MKSTRGCDKDLIIGMQMIEIANSAVHVIFKGEITSVDRQHQKASNDFSKISKTTRQSIIAVEPIFFAPITPSMDFGLWVPFRMLSLSCLLCALSNPYMSGHDATCSCFMITSHIN